MYLSWITKIILGILAAILSYFLATKFLPQTNPLKLPFLYQALAAFLGGLVVFFLGPVLGKFFRRLFFSLSRAMAVEVVRQLRDRWSPVKTKKTKQLVTGGQERLIILDTSAIIDGRIADVVQTGFLTGKILVPRFVLAELQHVADSEESLRRNRGKRGLQILDDMKKDKNINLRLWEGEMSGKNVDETLVSLAKTLKATIVTTDYNLNKVASVSGVKILNVNELANAVKVIALPGEEMTLKVVREGKEKTQGVGYLPDGTMIVVENGAGYIGQTINVVVSRVLQTVAGRMIFTEIKK